MRMQVTALRGSVVLALTGCLMGCQSRSVLPEIKEVKVSREPADKNCRESGLLTGTTTSAKGTAPQAMEDLKREAANKGANYVMIKEYSSYGTSVTGVAYECR